MTDDVVEDGDDGDGSDDDYDNDGQRQAVDAVGW